MDSNNHIEEVMEDNHDQLMRAHTHIWKYVFSSVHSGTLRCAVLLGIPDIIHSHGKPMPLSSLVAALSLPPAKTDYVHRLMRFLIHAGFFLTQKLDENQKQEEEEEEEEEGFVLTPSSRLLLKDNTTNMSSVVLAIVDPIFITPLHFLNTCYEEKSTGPSAFMAAYGMHFWKYLEKKPELSKVFNEAMANDSSLVMDVIFKEGKTVFDNLESLVDVGGGIGSAAKAISKAFPHIKCSVLDLPNVVADLPKDNNNIEFIGGDMLVSVPCANSVFMKDYIMLTYIYVTTNMQFNLHDWSDENCVKILKNCREAIPSREEGGKLILVDVVMEPEKKKENVHETETETQLLFDMMLLTQVDGKERTEKEWKKLFSESGFSDYKITPLLGFRSLIEVYP